MTNSVTIKYCGHSAVFIEAENSNSDKHSTVVAIDPWLSANPSCPEDCKQPPKIDLIVLTHGHADHASEAPQLAKRLGCKVAATWELAMIMGTEGVPEMNIVPMNKGGMIEIGGVEVALTHAFHSSSYDTANGPIYAGEPCGVIIKFGGTVIYHAGDTALFSDMRLIGERYKPHAALLPIGDRFTMGPQEAAEALKLIKPKVAVPIHFGTFPMLTGDPREFEKLGSRTCKIKVLEPGESINLSGYLD